MDQAGQHAHVVAVDSGVPLGAKADVHQLDSADWWHRRLARLIGAIADVEFDSRKVAADKVGVDAAEFGRWCDATRRPHFDRLLALAAFRTPLMLALCGLNPALEVVKQVRHIERRRVAR